MKSKKYCYEWEDFEDGDKDAKTMIDEILADPELSELEELVIGCWGESWDNGAQPIVDGIVECSDKFSQIKSLFIGDMDYEECEVSWIEQADYGKLWAALPNLEKLTIKGSTNLSLGDIQHENLKSLEIICGGLPTDVLEEVQNAKLPELTKLLLYIGSDNYGFDGDVTQIEQLLAQSQFPKLTYLGIVDSEIQDEVVNAVLNCKYINQIEILDLSLGTLTDKGGQALLEKIAQYPNIKKLDLHHHYLSDDMMKKLEALTIDVDMDEQEEADEYGDEVYYYAALTE